MNKLTWILGAAAMFAAGGAQAQGYYPGADLPPPAYAYYGQQYAPDTGCGRFTIVGAHAGVTVLGIDIGGGASASVPYCNGGEDYAPAYAPQAYAPPPQPVYQPPVYAPPPQPVYQPPMYAPRPMYAPYPCGCGAPQGW